MLQMTHPISLPPLDAKPANSLPTNLPPRHPSEKERERERNGSKEKLLPSLSPHSTHLHKQPLPLQEQRQHDRQGPRRNGQDVHLPYRLDDDIQNPLSRLRRQAVEEIRAGAGDGRADRLDRGVRQQLDNLLGRLVQKDAVGYGERDGRAANLSARDEADSQRDLFRLDLDLRDGEGGLGVGAGADADDDAVAVDGRRRGGAVDRVHERAADDGEDAADQVPGHIEAVLGHDDAVAQDREDHQADEREEPHAGVERAVALDELEEERDEVDGHEGDGDGRGRHGEEDDHGPALQEVDREDAARLRGEDGVRLLDANHDEEDARGDEQANDAARVPGVKIAAE